MARQLGVQRAGVGGQLVQVGAELGDRIDDHRQRLTDLFGQPPQRGIIARLQCRTCPPEAVDGAAVECVRVWCPAQRRACSSRGLPQGVQFGKPGDVGDQRHVLPRLRVDGVDLVEREFQPIGLLR
ncbi:Uncharacterised protein [Mycobacterium tuberculosis]|uniref:Uncharacterized protein n=1 Tax=Mycobacterium tuberculosis TaxID=1773 RepID=A0A0U0RJB6_MYCTX|nr:Uncharacterised protein [Mycobacterium tuberculosis]